MALTTRCNADWNYDMDWNSNSIPRIWNTPFGGPKYVIWHPLVARVCFIFIILGVDGLNIAEVYWSICRFRGSWAFGHPHLEATASVVCPSPAWSILDFWWGLYTFVRLIPPFISGISNLSASFSNVVFIPVCMMLHCPIFDKFLFCWFLLAVACRPHDFFFEHISPLHLC